MACSLLSILLRRLAADKGGYQVDDAGKAVVMCNLIRIAVIDDHPMFREGAIEMLKCADGFEVVGEGATADDALKVAQERIPDVILLDLYMPGGGINAAACIARDCPHIRIIVLTASEDEHDVALALQAGARGYILKGSSGSEVVEAVHAIVRGDFYVTPTLVARLQIDVTGLRQ